eukprot:2885571-Amphidinium_carterae.1
MAKLMFWPMRVPLSTAILSLMIHGPQLRERPDDEPRVRLPREPAEEEPETPIRGMVYPEAPFRLGPHLR